uniref:Uncharacterized protein n=1 Tax=Mastacembelus armatus TaxID=205130 RepID=A0A3Q3RMD6_9TELE
VLFAQGRGDHSQELLEVIRIHMELLRVHHAQIGVSVLDVVHVLHSLFQPTHHRLAMLGHFRVSQDGGIGGQVPKCCEVSLSPWIHNQNLGSNFTHVDLSPHIGDGAALSICPLYHVDDVKVFTRFKTNL